MANWKEYGVLGEKQNGKHCIKKMGVYFLTIGCSLLSLLLLCTSNVLSLPNDNIINNRLVHRLDKEFGSFVNDNYFKDKSFLSLNNNEETITYNWNLPDPPKADIKVCSSIVDKEKFDCFPRGVVTEEACTLRGCCYFATSGKVPSCFYPTGFRSFSYTSINTSDTGIYAVMKPNFKLPYPNVPPKLYVVMQWSDNILLVKMLYSIIPPPQHFNIFNAYKGNDFSGVQKNRTFDVIVNPDTVGFKVVRKSTNVTIFDSEDIGGFMFTNQFIQISTKLSCKHLYGLGEGRTDFPLNTNWKVRTLWNHDTIPTNDINGYGSYPMYLCPEVGSASAHVVAFGNPYAQDFILQPDALTYRTIGTPLIIGFFLGDSPLEAVQLASSSMGSSIIPPYWSLGYHQCRLGYNSLNNMIAVWNKTRASGIPFDTQWADIDYMKNRNDFTLDPQFEGLGDFVEKLHVVGMHFVPILEPGISAGEPKGTYPPFDRGMELDIFIKDSTGEKPLIGKVWNPVSTVFPDFTHPKIIPYWYEMINNFHKEVPFDGVWIDMNEPSNFVNGSLTGCPNNNLENPPYVPGVDGGVLDYLTICMSARHAMGPHYLMHNTHGFFEASVTDTVLSQIRSKRPFIITRAGTFAIGSFAGHWTGDVMSTWEDMAQTVKDIMHLSMYGVHMTGADICGFNGNTTASLCRRWYQLGAFYPFSRNHNSDDCIDQDPVALDIVESTKKALRLKYSLLPYLYTLFWQARTHGLPVIRPLFYLFPEDDAAYKVNTQFMWGDGLLISPVLNEGHTYVKAYLGKSIWYDIYTSEKIVSNSSQPYALAAPEDTIPVLIRGGTILVMQEPEVTTTLTRKNPFLLKVALNENNTASGMLFWDDGETIEGDYSTIYYGVTNNTLMSCNDVRKYKIDLYMNRIEIFAINKVDKVTVSINMAKNVNNVKPVPFSYNSTMKVLTLDNLKLPMQRDFNITWV